MAFPLRFPWLFVLLSCTLFSPEICPGQTMSRKVTGTVLEKRGQEPISAIVMVKESGATLGYAYTDDHGGFSVDFKSAADSIDLEIRAIGYEMFGSRIFVNAEKRVYLLQENRENLKEAVIRAPRMETAGDTIKYIVSSFADKNDAVIEDVLRRMPGIKVLDSGKILYNGEEVSLNIDGMDMLKGRYAVATKNIPHNMIASVEILENDQVIKALNNLIPGDKTTLNLKLKAAARGVWVWPFGAEAGWSVPKTLALNVQASPLCLGSRHQHLATASFDNSGKDIGATMKDLAEGASIRFTSIPEGGPGHLSARRHTFNEDWSVSSNNLFKTLRDRVVVANAGLVHEYRSRSRWMSTEWMLPADSVVSTHENIGSELTGDRFYADLSFTRNDRRAYLNGTFALSGEQDAESGHVNLLDQGLGSRRIQLKGNLSAIDRYTDLSAWRMNAQISVYHDDETLSVEEANVTDRSQWLQYGRVRASMLFSQVQSLHLLGAWSLSPSIRIAYGDDRLKSSLSVSDLSVLNGANATNDLSLHQFDAQLRGDLFRTMSGTSIGLELPFIWRYRMLSDIEQIKSKRFLLEPVLKISHRFSSETSIEFRYSLAHSDPGVARLYRGAVMTTYRQYRFYTPDLTAGLNHTLIFRWKYMDIIRMQNYGIQVQYRITNPRILYGQALSGMVSHSISTPTNCLGHTVSGSFSYDRNFYSADASLRMELSLSASSLPIYTQSLVAELESFGAEPSLSVSARPAKWLSLSDRVQASWYRQRLNGGSFSQKALTARNVLSLNLALSDRLSLTTEAELYGTTAYDDHFFWLLDAAVQYSFGKSRLMLKGSNLLNTNEYVCTLLTPEYSTQSGYRIRPAEVRLSLTTTF